MSTVNNLASPFLPRVPSSTNFADASDPRPAERTAPIGSLLPPEEAMLVSGEPGAMVAALIVMSSKSQAGSLREERNAQAHMQEQAEQSKLDHMHDAADAREMAGLMSGGAGVLGGTVQACSPGNAGQMSNQVIKGDGEIGAALFKFDADRGDAKVASDEMVITEAKRNYENSSDDFKGAKKVINDAIDFYREYCTSKAQVEQAAIQKV